MPIEKYNSQTVTKPFQVFWQSPKTERSLHSHFLPRFQWIPGDQGMKLPINQIPFYRKSSKPNAKTHANDLENINSDLSCQNMPSTTQLTKHFKTELSSSYSKKGGRPTLAGFFLILYWLCQKRAQSGQIALELFQTLCNALQCFGECASKT